jgi:hypothetical protein
MSYVLDVQILDTLYLLLFNIDAIKKACTRCFRYIFYSTLQ